MIAKILTILIIVWSRCLKAQGSEELLHNVYEEPSVNSEYNLRGESREREGANSFQRPRVYNWQPRFSLLEGRPDTQFGQYNTNPKPENGRSIYQARFEDYNEKKAPMNYPDDDYYDYEVKPLKYKYTKKTGGEIRPRFHKDNKADAQGPGYLTFENSALPTLNQNAFMNSRNYRKTWSFYNPDSVPRYPRASELGGRPRDQPNKKALTPPSTSLTPVTNAIINASIVAVHLTSTSPIPHSKTASNSTGAETALAQKQCQSSANKVFGKFLEEIKKENIAINGKMLLDVLECSLLVSQGFSEREKEGSEKAVKPDKNVTDGVKLGDFIDQIKHTFGDSSKTLLSQMKEALLQNKPEANNSKSNHSSVGDESSQVKPPTDRPREEITTPVVTLNKSTTRPNDTRSSGDDKKNASINSLRDPKLINMLRKTTAREKSEEPQTEVSPTMASFKSVRTNTSATYNKTNLLLKSNLSLQQNLEKLHHLIAFELNKLMPLRVKENIDSWAGENEMKKKLLANQSDFAVKINFDRSKDKQNTIDHESILANGVAYPLEINANGDSKNTFLGKQVVSIVPPINTMNTARVGSSHAGSVTSLKKPESRSNTRQGSKIKAFRNLGKKSDKGFNEVTRFSKNKSTSETEKLTKKPSNQKFHCESKKIANRMKSKIAKRSILRDHGVLSLDKQQETEYGDYNDDQELQTDEYPRKEGKPKTQRINVEGEEIKHRADKTVMLPVRPLVNGNDELAEESVTSLNEYIEESSSEAQVRTSQDGKQQEMRNEGDEGSTSLNMTKADFVGSYQDTTESGAHSDSICHPPVGPAKNPDDSGRTDGGAEYEDALTGKTARRIIEAMLGKVKKSVKLQNELGICANLTDQGVCLPPAVSDGVSKQARDHALRRIGEFLERLPLRPMRETCMSITPDLKYFLEWLTQNTPLSTSKHKFGRRSRSDPNIIYSNPEKGTPFYKRSYLDYFSYPDSEELNPFGADLYVDPLLPATLHGNPSSKDSDVGSISGDSGFKEEKQYPEQNPVRRRLKQRAAQEYFLRPELEYEVPVIIKPHWSIRNK